MSEFRDDKNVNYLKDTVEWYWKIPKTQFKLRYGEKDLDDDER